MGSVSSTQTRVEKILKSYPLRKNLIFKVSQVVEKADTNILVKLFNCSSNPEKILFIFVRIYHMFDSQRMIPECLHEIEFPQTPVTLAAAIFYLTRNKNENITDVDLSSTIENLNYIEKYSGTYRTSISFILQGLINGLINSGYHIKDRLAIIKNVLSKIKVADKHYMGNISDKCVILETCDYDLYFIDELFRFQSDREIKSFFLDSTKTIN